ncbi:MAG: DUF547 domain-containing protein [Deltaproteobacteria bacterium]|nr:DUF547 domain-containing protein [Deltaproteobacteria bacterium]
MVKILPLVLVAALLLAAQPAHSAEPGAAVDYSPYAELLREHVRGGLVDYAGIQRQRAKLERFLENLAQVDPGSLSRDQKLAYYINAYNAWTIWLILTKYPDLESIKDLGGLFSSPWDKEIVRLNGKVFTLDQIEHEVLRPTFKDPRIHFAVNCASKGCPPLLNRPYTGAEVQGQLQAQATAFINDPARTRLQGNTLYVTKIMDWFSEDFDDDPVGFVKKYAQDDFKRRLEGLGGQVEVEYLDYDWSLNNR